MSARNVITAKGTVIRALLRGCANRPFFHIIVQQRNKDVFDEDAVLEQLGTYDPMPNEAGEKLVSLNFDRLKYWIGSGAQPNGTVLQLLGLSGFYPIHPMSYIIARRNRLKMSKKLEETQTAEIEKVAEKSSKESSS